MIVNLVFVCVKPEDRDAFRTATLVNARESRKEPGVARFDILADTADTSRFVLIEAFKNEEAPKKHKETAHYAKWRETVEPMMAEPRKSVNCVGIDPPDGNW